MPDFSHMGGLTVVDLEAAGDLWELVGQLSCAGESKGPGFLVGGHNMVPFFDRQRSEWARAAEPSDMALVVGGKSGAASSWRDAACAHAAALLSLGLVPNGRKWLVIASDRMLKGADVAWLKRKGAVALWSARISDGGLVPPGDLIPAKGRHGRTFARYSGPSVTAKEAKAAAAVAVVLDSAHRWMAEALHAVRGEVGIWEMTAALAAADSLIPFPCGPHEETLAALAPAERDLDRDRAVAQAVEVTWDDFPNDGRAGLALRIRDRMRVLEAVCGPYGGPQVPWSRPEDAAGAVLEATEGRWEALEAALGALDAGVALEDVLGPR